MNQLYSTLTAFQTTSTTQMESVNNKLDALTTRVENAIEKSEEAMVLAREAKQQGSENEQAMVLMRKEFDDMKLLCEGLQSRTTQLELYSRKPNLIFEGIEEQGEDNCISRVRHVIDENLEIDSNELNIVSCHRVKTSRKPNPIYCRFASINDRNRVFSSVKKLKDSPYVIREDFPKEIVDKRRILYPVYKNALKSGKSAKLIGDKLIIDGVHYDVQTVNKIPHLLPPPRQYEKITDVTVAFFGEGSMFSNFHKCEFVVNGDSFASVEAYYQSRKALHLQRYDLAKNIMAASHPAQCKRIGDSLLSSAAFRTESLQWMRDGVRAKFTQNNELKTALLNTGTKNIMEAGPDKFWATGNLLQSPDPTNIDYPGKNMLGKILVDLREELK